MSLTCFLGKLLIYFWGKNKLFYIFGVAGGVFFSFRKILSTVSNIENRKRIINWICSSHEYIFKIDFPQIACISVCPAKFRNLILEFLLNLFFIVIFSGTFNNSIIIDKYPFIKLIVRKPIIDAFFSFPIELAERLAINDLPLAARCTYFRFLKFNCLTLPARRKNNDWHLIDILI